MLTPSLLMDIETNPINSVLTYNQEDIKIDIYMALLLGFDIDRYTRKYQVIKLIVYLYGLKDARITSFEHLKRGLENRGFVQFNLYLCTWYNHVLILLLYLDYFFLFITQWNTWKNPEMFEHMV